MFSGSYGLVLLPEAFGLLEEAQKLAERYTPSATYKVAIPHITLYHARLRELPEENVQRSLDLLKPILGQRNTFIRLEPYGGKFLFWDLEKDPQLMLAHGLALMAMSPFLDREGVARAVSEGLKLKDEERLSLERYGHPLMGELYRPHLTISYDPNGIAQEPVMTRVNCSYSGAAFVEIGEQGRVQKVIHERRWR